MCGVREYIHTMQLLDNIQTFQLLDDPNLYEDDRKPVLAL